MIHYVFANDIWEKFPDMAASMYRDRATQFKHRLGWDVFVDAAGYERDEYDLENPLYVIWQRGDGSHGASMRFLPTTGPCMYNDHFLDLTGREIRSSWTLECTRFCTSPGGNAEEPAALMLAGGQIMRNWGFTHFLGVFDARMERMYRRIGSTPETLGSEGEGRGKISVGLWEYSVADEQRIADGCGVSVEDVAACWGRCFPVPVQPWGIDTKPLRPVA